MAAYKPLLPLRDFQRIFQVLHGMVLYEGLDPAKSCMFFNVIGAAILNKHYGLEANPVVGAVAFCLDHTNEVILAFGDEVDGTLTTSKAKGSFHCWVEVEGWLIDFSSPLYREILFSIGVVNRCGRKVFQKLLVEASGTCELKSIGSFYCLADSSPSNDTISIFNTDQVFIDLKRISLDWYIAPPKDLKEGPIIGRSKGGCNQVAPSSLMVSGFW